MAGAEERFKSRLRDNLQGELTVGSEPSDLQVAGVILEALLQPLLDAAVSIVMKCIKDRLPQDVAASMNDPGIWERWAIKEAVNDNPEIPDDQKRKCQKALLATLRGSSPEDCVELAGVAKAKRKWGLA